ncbi:sodium:calcium antiporter [Candidatus Uhrbacteria bacterium]|nr:sodium:calcium antiporter [Candidatus Uhrbacteria bacterium]
MVVSAFIIALFFLFYLLGKSADVVVKRVRIISERLGIHVFFMGIILGLFTTLPEITIAVNSLINNIPDISLGNLMGGFIVLLGLILGTSLIASRRVHTDGNLMHFAPMLCYFFLPFLFLTDGEMSRIESFVLVVAYFVVLVHVYRSYKNDITKDKQIVKIRTATILKDIFIIFFGIVSLALLSTGIIRLTEGFLLEVHVSQFLIGVLLFSVGTNLPEIIVAFRAWQKSMKELTLSNLAGSALADPLVIGIMSFIQPYHLQVNAVYYIFMAFNALLFILVGIFYKTGKVLSRKEGIALLAMYGIFLSAELAFGLKI